MLNHKVITDHLVKMGFTQPIPGKTGCWINHQGIIVYYAANNGTKPIYIACYKLDRWEFTELTQFDAILGAVINKINAKNNEIIHSYATENARK